MFAMFALLCGAIIVMGIYHGMIYGFTRETVYLSYTFYIVTVFFCLLSLSGHMFLLDSSESKWFSSRSVQVSSFVAVYGISIFTDHFLKLKEHLPWAHRYFSIGLVTHQCRALMGNILRYPLTHIYRLVLAIDSPINLYLLVRQFNAMEQRRHGSQNFLHHLLCLDAGRHH